MIFYSEVITSRNNPTVKWAASLSDKKGRNESGAFIAEGEKLTFEALSAGLKVTHIFVLESKKSAIFARLNEYNTRDEFKDCAVIVLSEGAFEKISTEKSPQGVIAAIKYLDFFRELDIIYKEDFIFNNSERLIILCSLRDPGNLGAVIRSSAAFGVDHIILTSDSADLYNPKTVRSAMGSLFHLKATVVKDLAASISELKSAGRRVFAAELSENALPLSDVRMSSMDVVIIGNEGHGIPKEISSLCDSSVYIPISKNTESLNASVAASIFIWEQSKA